MTHVFEKRRSRLQAMKELHERYLPPEQMLPCPGCHRELPRAEVDKALSVCPACGHHFPIGSAQRHSGKFQNLQNIGITHFIADGDSKEIKICDGILRFQCKQRNLFFPQQLIQISPW